MKIQTIGKILFYTALLAPSIVLSGCSANLDKSEIKRSEYPNAKFRGRLQTDYSFADAQNTGVEFDDLELRRAYYGLSGKLSKQVAYAVDGSINEEGDLDLVGASVKWSPETSQWTYQLGQFKTPMSLDESTSSKYISTLERAAFTDAFEIDRRLGIAMSQKGKRHTFSVGVFGSGPIDDSPLSNGNAVSARATFAPIDTKKRTVHFGASARYRTEDDDEIRYRQRPYAHISDRIVSTGRIADSDLFTGIEAALIDKSVWLAGEYGTIKADCPDCSSDPSFDGYFIEAGNFWGGRKTYDDGSFSRPKIDRSIKEGGYGAFSIVARYDVLDLMDKDTMGGKLSTWVLGTDWWPTNHIRVAANYFRSKAILGDSGSGIASEFDDFQDDGGTVETVDGFVIRAQIDF